MLYTGGGIITASEQEQQDYTSRGTTTLEFYNKRSTTTRECLNYIVNDM